MSNLYVHLTPVTANSIRNLYLFTSNKNNNRIIFWYFEENILVFRNF